ncbi:hypothetical protein D1007_26061 [Hordeum vulgare]|nr:hypothetical protein D1007_26061 [Hordeum vulgare]
MGDLYSLESSQLRLADKNLETSGNPHPSYKILHAISDPQLVLILEDSGFALGYEGGPIVCMIRAREEAQVALAEAADAAKAREANAAAISAADTAGAVSGALMLVFLGGEAETSEADATPSTSRAPTKKRVAKPVTSRGVRLRNRII